MRGGRLGEVREMRGWERSVWEVGVMRENEGMESRRSEGTRSKEETQEVDVRKNWVRGSRLK